MHLNLKLLAQNALSAAAVCFLFLLILAVCATLLLRFMRLMFGTQPASEEPSLFQRFRRIVMNWTLTLAVFTVLLGGAGVVLTSLYEISISTLLHERIFQLDQKEWTEIALSGLKPVAFLLLAWLTNRLLSRLLLFIRDRLQQRETLSGHREQLIVYFDNLRSGLSAVLLFGTVYLGAQLFAIPDSLRRLLVAISYVAGAFPLARCAVSTAHLAIDVVFDLSARLEKTDGMLRYLGRLRHLAPLAKRAADYLLYVAIATWTADQLTPGTWAAQAGRIALRVIVIFFLSRLLIEVCLLFLNEFFLLRGNQDSAEYQQRQTLVPVAASILRYLIYFMAVVMSLKEVGLDPTPVLAGAGVAGIAVGLGAQSFIGDLVAGFFILFENLFLVGDQIEVGEAKGKVEEIGVRTTKIRDDEGILHIIPNGEVRRIASRSKGYVNVVVDLPVPYGEDLHRLFDLIQKKMVEVREAHSDITGPTELTIEELSNEGLVVRSVTMVKPGASDEMSDVVRLAFWETLRAAQTMAPHRRMLLLSASTDSGSSVPIESRSTRPQLLRTDIQKIKAYNLYLALDVDHNGYLEISDIDAFAQRLTTTMEKEPDASLRVRLHATLHAYWREITQFVDRNADGRISREEFLSFCSAMADDLSGPAGDAVNAMANIIFTVYDQNRSATLSEREFLQFTRAHGLLDSVSSAGFRLIDRDQSGHISKEEWLRFLRDVFVSRKLNDASAVVFGPGCRDTASAS